MAPRAKPRSKQTAFAPVAAASARPAQEIFAEAVGHHLAGRIAEAESGYRRVIAQQPEFAEALNNLGVLVRQNDTQAAHDLFERAVLARPDYIEALVNLALSAQERGETDRAIGSYRRVLGIDANQGRALNDLGAILRGQGEFDEAELLLRRAVASLPNDASTHNNLGNVLLETGRLEEARSSYERALAIDANNPDALNNLGTTFRGLRRPEKAVPLFMRALELRPGFLDVMHNLALALPPGVPGADEIEGLLRAQIAKLPQNAAVLAVLAVFLQESGRFAEAKALAEDVLRRDQNNADAWTVLGVCYAEECNPREAVRCYDRAEEINPRLGVARWNRAIARLALGDYEQGWREYESRWTLVHMAFDRRLLDAPEWDGSPIDGKTLFLYTEQGLGDAIQFARFGAEVKRRWRARIILECDASLVTLFRSCAWVDGVVARGAQRPAFDTHVSLLSLPRILGNTIDNIPTEPSFPIVARPVANRIQKHAGVLDVGIVWGGRAPNPALARRSVNLEMLAPFSRIPGIRLHSLQLGDTSGQLERCSFRSSINDVAPHIADFVDTAAVMSKLDLVITIDTSVAHLAGALGVPVWVMLIRNADWRWLLDRSDSPWYPSARLFRQREPGDWRPVVDEVTSALRELATEPAASRARAVGQPATAIAELPSQQRDVHGETRFTVAIPITRLADTEAFETYSTELAGDGVDPEVRNFLDAELRATDTVIDIDGPLGITALAAATAPQLPALVIAVARTSDDAAIIADAARSTDRISSVRVHVRGDARETTIDALLARYSPDAPRVIVRAHEPGQLLDILSGAANALTHGRIAAFLWALSAADDTMPMGALSALGFEHFVMTEDESGPLFVPFGDNSASRTVFSLIVSRFEAEQDTSLPIVGLDWQVGATSGWGVYGMNLSRRALASGAALPAPILPPAMDGMAPDVAEAIAPVVAAHREVRDAISENGSGQTRVPFLMLRALGNGLCLAPHSAPVLARRNVGVVFFEDTALDTAAIERANRFDRIIAGSTWNAEVLRARGVRNVTTVLQGVDASLLQPRPRKPPRRDQFIVFSGGKLEYRKGQDIAAAAFREFVKRHPEARLMIAWHNHWPQTMAEIPAAGHVTGTPSVDSLGRADMTGWLASNGIPSHAVIDLGLRGNAEMASLIAQADVALFTNRAEGGTNLVAMECLAAGVPTILSANTGHLDLVDDARCYALRSQGPCKSTPSFRGVDGWGESSVDETLEALERVYANPAEAMRRTDSAAEWMAGLTWDAQIDKLFDSIRDLL